MSKTLDRLLCVLAACCIVFVIGAVILLARIDLTNRSMQGLIDNGNQTISTLNATLAAVNAPCTSFHGSATCGPIAQLSQTEKNIGIMAGQTALQVKQSAVLINSSADTIAQTGSHVNEALDQVRTTVRDVGAQASSTLAVTGQAVKDNALILETTQANISGAVFDFDKLLKSPGVTDTIDGMGKTSQNLASSTGDFQIRFHALLFPPPCKTFGCRFNRYVIPAVRDGAAFGESTYWTTQLFENVKP